MGVDILRGRFTVVRAPNLLQPIEIISSSNTFERNWATGGMTQARDFFPALKGCAQANGEDFVSKPVVEKCLMEQYERLKEGGTKISDVYQNFPATAKGYVAGFFKHAISEADFDKGYGLKKGNAHNFEKYQLKHLKSVEFVQGLIK